MGDGFFDGFVVGAGIIAIILIILVAYTGVDSYRRGQIDAVTGNMKYERVMQSDSTVTWEKKTK
jgi:hypothetical protein